MITIEKYNETFLRIFTEPSIEQELSDFFSFKADGYRFHPKYKAKLWDGNIRLFKQSTKTLYVGLLDYVIDFAKRNQYEYNIKAFDSICNNISIDSIKEFVTSLNLSTKHNLIEARDYQIDAIHKAIDLNRITLQSPTGSGKSLILYAIMRWHLNHNRKIILIVPSTQLVEQMYNDFRDYSFYTNWNVDDHCQKVYSGFSKILEKDVIISTWQSLQSELPKSSTGSAKSSTGSAKAYFNQFDVTMVDECHGVKATQLTSILEMMADVKYRIGVTGTIDDSSKTNKLVLEGLLGRVHKIITTRELMDQNSLVNLKINAIILKYDEDIRKGFKQLKYTYQDEINWLVNNPERNKFIRNLAISTQGLTLVLFNYVESHGKVLYDMISSKCKDKDVYFIHGSISTKEREHIRQLCTDNTNAIIVASFGTMSTGINIPGIENIIFASPTKSKIRNLQSIGRGLRLKAGKSECKLFDITDDLHWKAHKNYTLLHGLERYKIYHSEQFKMKMIEVEING